MRFAWTNDDRYAGGERMMLTTIEPAFTWSIFDDPKYDFVDYGIGAGFLLGQLKSLSISEGRVSRTGTIRLSLADAHSEPHDPLEDSAVPGLTVWVG